MPVNTAALKTFAPAMRRQLLEAVGRKLDLLLISQTPDTLSTYASQIAELRDQEANNRGQLLERVAYTWFNRLCALRYLDARGWHPFGCKVLMPATAAESQPELLKLMRSGALPAALQNQANTSRLNGLLDGQIAPAIAGADPQCEVYRELILVVCRSYHQLLPNLFEELDDASELLLPDDLLSDGSIAGGFRHQISDSDCDDVEIIGWLYQFYISEKKDQVIGKVVKSEDIPAATQLFTPNWIVKYMVQNSLGAQWLATYPASALKGQMEYYIEPAEQTDDVKAQLAAITPESLNPEELTLIDPACGSGHILVEAYELFKAIYLERGYQQREIPQLILEKNLFGLDIDERAAQLTSFALMMKGRGDDRRLFERGIQLNVMALVNSDGLDVEALANAINLADHGLKLADLVELKQLFEHATTFGSLIQVPGRLAEKLPAMRRLSELKGQEMIVAKGLKCLEPLVRQAELLAARYDAVVANPPYVGNKYHIPILKKFLKERYEGYDKDLFSAFIDRGLVLSKRYGRLGFMSPFVWMFISSHERLRNRLISMELITTLVQLEYSGFEGATVPICTFTLRKGRISGYRGSYIRLSDFRGASNQGPKVLEAIKNSDCGWMFSADQDDFKKIPGRPLAYWATAGVFNAFKAHPALSEAGNTRLPMTTGDNGRFLRQWHEVAIDRIGFGCRSRKDSAASSKRWFPCNKGGPFRRWYGNNCIVIDWENDGERILDLNTQLYGSPSRNIRSMDVYFRESITWSSVSSSTFSARHSPEGFLFATGGSCAFPEAKDRELVLGALLSNVSDYLLQFLSPTLNFEVGTVGILPLAKPSQQEKVSR